MTDNDTITITVTRMQAEQLAQIVANVNVAYVVSRPLIDAIMEGINAGARSDTPVDTHASLFDGPEAPDEPREHTN